jgi:hypothetical protein
VRKQIGHSVASLYKKTSMGCPLTKGSCGKLISRGRKSAVDPFRELPPRTAAMAFPRGLNEELVPGAWLEIGDGSAEPGLDMARSEEADCDRSPIGIVRLSKFGFDCGRGLAETGRGMSSSGGISSAGGMGSPRAAAMIWGSVHWSL